MSNSKQEQWLRFQKYYFEFPSVHLALDLSRMNFADDFISAMEPAMQKAFSAMAGLEKGAIANPDENRMVGHYWLRNPALAPTDQIRRQIETTLVAIKQFANEVHSEAVSGPLGRFKTILLVGIGGSALGPQFVSNALSQPGIDKLSIRFFDNTDPDGMDRVLAAIRGGLGATLSIIVSKSGGTKETRNGMLLLEEAYKRAGLRFGNHAVAVTSENSDLDKHAFEGNWLRRFPMWDWVGGRTSELSAVGLLPAALQGFDIDSILAGARAADEVTRSAVVKENPSALMALMWYYAGNGKGTRNLVILPYKDRLELFSKYLQQLIMESLGKQNDLADRIVNQGITVLGNKGSTDQHSYIQQLRDGVNNFFVNFIEVLKDHDGDPFTVEPNVTIGDYLSGFLQGTRLALHENGRESVTITIRELTPFSIGMLIALFERTVGLYASLININAYHQPGVEAGKKAANAVINLQCRILDCLGDPGAGFLGPAELARRINAPGEEESIFKICEHLAANPARGVSKRDGKLPWDSVYGRS